MEEKPFIVDLNAYRETGIVFENDKPGAHWLTILLLQSMLNDLLNSIRNDEFELLTKECELLRVSKKAIDEISERNFSNGFPEDLQKYLDSVSS